MLQTEKQRATYKQMIDALKTAGFKSHALVAVDEEGHLYWGASFGHEPEAMLRALRTIQHDIRQYMKSSSYTALPSLPEADEGTTADD